MARARVATRNPPTLVKALAAGVAAVLASAALASPTSATRAVRGASAAAPASSARTISLNETGHLQLTSKHDFTLNERGSATGTIAGLIYVHLTAVSSSRVTVEVNIYPHGGSISGSGSGAYHRSGSTAHFSGAMSFGRGSGKYARAHGSNLRFSGTIEESNRDAITVFVAGTVSG